MKNGLIRLIKTELWLVELIRAASTENWDISTGYSELQCFDWFASEASTRGEAARTHIHTSYIYTCIG